MLSRDGGGEGEAGILNLTLRMTIILHFLINSQDLRNYLQFVTYSYNMACHDVYFFNKCILSLDKKVLDFDKTICREWIHVRSFHMKYCEWCFHLLVIQLNR